MSQIIDKFGIRRKRNHPVNIIHFKYNGLKSINFGTTLEVYMASRLFKLTTCNLGE